MKGDVNESIGQEIEMTLPPPKNFCGKNNFGQSKGPMQKNCFTLFDHCPDYGPNLCKEHMLTLSQRKSIFRAVT